MGEILQIIVEGGRFFAERHRRKTHIGIRKKIPRPARLTTLMIPHVP